ncbi:energy-coupling factor transporter transmembrane component T family protein [Halorubellus salinus]|uniref:energy-coupling factor transporter transmembrane component T family protein n=1 Tax=Halorubellus salinus TaxID=755309 RepID=UPI001D07CF6F|nr:energy-coupling factor transporter transmembrane protein EcfT [Halorubellus salinus]
MRYEPGESLLHALDPRSKLALQVAFAVAAFAHTTPRGLAALTLLALGVLAAARLSPVAVVSDLRVVLPFLVLAPLVEGARLGAPWFDVAAARFPALAAYRVLLVLLVSAAYVHTTRTRQSRAAVQWLVPGRVGQLLGMGVALVFRFVPVLLDDVRRSRAAMRARLGSERPLRDRMRLVATSGLNRAFARADALAVALQARCFAYNPTLPPLSFDRRDWVVTLSAFALAVGALAV